MRQWGLDLGDFGRDDCEVNNGKPSPRRTGRDYFRVIYLKLCKYLATERVRIRRFVVGRFWRTRRRIELGTERV